MNDLLEQLIEDSFGQRAATVRPGPRLDAEALITAGRRARRRRRAVLAASVVVLLAAGGGAATVWPRRAAPPTVTIAPPTTLDSLGLDVLSATHGVIIRTNDGLRVRIASPDATKVVRATRVPGGWVAEADLSRTARRLLFVHSDGSTQTIATFDAAGNYQFSPNGRELVVTHMTDELDESVAAFDLPSLVNEGGMGGPPARNLRVAAMVGSYVLMSDPSGISGAVNSAWSIEVKAGFPDLPDTFALLGSSTSGDVLVVRAVKDAHGHQVEACVSVVPLTAMDRAALAPATCHLAATNPTGTISPDGSEVFLDGAAFRGLYRVADLQAGTAVATPLPAGLADFHVGDGTVQPWVRIPLLHPKIVLEAPGPAGTTRFIACDAVAACGELPFPPGLDDPVPVPRLPG